MKIVHRPDLPWSKKHQLLLNLDEVIIVFYNAPNSIPGILIHREVQQWLKQNDIECMYEGGSYLLFDTEADAVAFKMRWGGE